MQLTPEQLFRLGGELDRCVQSEAFQLAIDILKDQYASEMLNTKPSDKEGRERIYRLNHALDDVYSTINSMAQISRDEAARRETETD